MVTALNYSSTGRLTAYKGLDQTQPPNVRLFDDFVSTLDTNYWTATNTAGGGAGSAAFAFSTSAGAPSAAHGGWLRGTVSDNAAGVTELAGAKVTWLPSRAGDGTLIFHTRVSLPAVTACNMSCGWSDLVTQGNGTAMNISGTTVLVTTAANGACWVYDTRATTAKFIGASVDNNVDSCANTTLAAQGFTPVLGTSYELRVELDALGNAFFYYGTADAPGQALTYAGRQAAAGTTLKATLLTPYLGMDNAGAGANKSLDVDFIFVGCAR
jgi:hypothetical protein